MAEHSATPRGLLDSLAGLTLAGAGVALMMLTLVEAWQVFARYVVHSPPGWTEPVALLFLKFALMLGAAFGVREETHFRFLLGLQATGKRGRQVLEGVARVTAAGLGLALALWGARMMLDTWAVQIPGAPLPTGLYFAPFVIGGALIVVFAVERLVYDATVHE
jgi:TRAP-type C4-dicarboxylate transport system permease small subunit